MSSPAENSPPVADSPSVANPLPAPPVSRRKILWRRIKWSIRIGVLLLILGAFLVGFDGCFYYPTREVIYTPKTWNLAYEEVTFKTSDGVNLSGWFIPAQGRTRDGTKTPAKGTVIHFHGNAENMTGHVSFVYWLPEAGYNLFVFDYRGYGKSEGSVTRKGTILDGHAALDYILSRPDVDKQRVFLFGQSLGGAVGVVVAAERPEIRAVVVDSTFSGYRRIAARHLRKTLYFEWPAKALAHLAVSAEYDPIDYVQRLAPRPLLVIASGQDRIVFPELGRELFDAAGEPKEFWLVPEADHTETLSLKYDEARRRITEWFEGAAEAKP